MNGPGAHVPARLIGICLERKGSSLDGSDIVIRLVSRLGNDFYINDYLLFYSLTSSASLLAMDVYPSFFFHFLILFSNFCQSLSPSQSTCEW